MTAERNPYLALTNEPLYMEMNYRRAYKLCIKLLLTN